MTLTCVDIARAALGEPASIRGNEVCWKCPRHQDQHPSLSINSAKDCWACFPCGAKGKAWALVAFFAGVEPSDKEAVKSWLRERGLLKGAKRKPKAGERGPCVATYSYTDPSGNPIARKLRFEPGADGRPKDFAWERFEVGKWVSGLGGLRLPLYRLKEIASERSVILVEGEKDADAGAKIGLPTTTSGGVNSWRDDHAESLRGKAVVIIADADEPGRVHAQKVAASVFGKAASMRVCEIPGSKDLAEGIERGWTRERLLALFREAPEWKPASGAEILDLLMDFVRRFVSLTDSQARAVTLWAAHTHVFEAADCTPYLAINSPEKGCGKTRLLEVLNLLVCKPWFTGRVTAAVLTRKVDSELPALLLDEADSAFRGEEPYAEALRGVLNSGYRRGGSSSLCIGQGANMTYKDFSTFCPKAIAGIGKLPDTVVDRSIRIRLKRAPRGKTEKFRERKTGREAEGIKAKLAAWCSTNLQPLREAQPEVPESLPDRQSDVCEPLLAIADAAGGDWPQAARAALAKLCGEAQAADDSVGVQLLRDIRTVFDQKQVDELPSVALADALAAIETSPWGEWSKDKPLSPAKLARLLKPFDVYPRQIQNGQARGYQLGQFQEAFALYLPSESVKVSETQYPCGSDADFKVSNEAASDTLENAVSPNIHAPSGHFDTLKPGKQAKNAQNQPVQRVIAGVLE